MIRKSNKKNNRRQHIIGRDLPFAVVEAYKSARTSLTFTNVSDGCNIIAFTSAEPGEGKTITCINMAISLAESGKKVLLVDSDMRKPQVAATMRVSGVPGLSELLSGLVDANARPDLCRQPSGYENLDIISAGSIPPNPAELIAGVRAQKLFERLAGEYDYILIDTPPSLVVTDALLYKNIVSGYVIVVRANKSRSDSTTKLIERFKQIDARVIGFILNDSERRGKRYKNYNYYSQK